MRKVSLLEAFRRSAYAPLLTRIPPETDIFHTNSLEVFDGSLVARSSLFRRGNILISVRSFDVLAILSGGNTLVVESNFGRALEVTPDDRVVWEFINPNRAGKEGHIATLVQMERVPRDLPFLKGAGAPSVPPADPPR